ncbi:type II secretion system F family protein [Arthrobacter sp. MSA 4-2]|nr:type II secretion system F family protein [Arthrobacter sp. MSA 4-2]
MVMCVTAVFITMTVVFRPRQRAIPLERRRPNGHPELSVFSRVTESTVSAVDGALGASGGLYSPAALYNAGLKTKPADFTVLVLVATLVLGIVGTLLTNLLLGIVLAAITPLLAKIMLAFLTDKRRSKFDAQLSDTIQMLIGGLRVGHSMMRSIDAAAKEADAPTSEELARIVNETRIGKDSHQAIEESAARMRSEDFKWIAQAIQINREVGGDLAGVLEEVAGTIRERSEIKGQIKSLSAEGKMSAYVLMGLPVGVAIAFSFINPGYLNVFVEDVRGIAMLVGSLLMFALGGFWLSRIVKVRF